MRLEYKDKHACSAPSCPVCSVDKHTGYVRSRDRSVFMMRVFEIQREGRLRNARTHYESLTDTVLDWGFRFSKLLASGRSESKLLMPFQTANAKELTGACVAGVPAVMVEGYFGVTSDQSNLRSILTEEDIPPSLAWAARDKEA